MSAACGGCAPEPSPPRAGPRQRRQVGPIRMIPAPTHARSVPRQPGTWLSMASTGTGLPTLEKLGVAVGNHDAGSTAEGEPSGRPVRRGASPGFADLVLAIHRLVWRAVDVAQNADARHALGLTPGLLRRRKRCRDLGASAADVARLPGLQVAFPARRLSASGIGRDGDQDYLEY